MNLFKFFVLYLKGQPIYNVTFFLGGGGQKLGIDSCKKFEKFIGDAQNVDLMFR